MLRKIILWLIGPKADRHYCKFKTVSIMETPVYNDKMVREQCTECGRVRRYMNGILVSDSKQEL
jgi:hypothetical protein